MRGAALLLTLALTGCGAAGTTTLIPGPTETVTEHAPPAAGALVAVSDPGDVTDVTGLAARPVGSCTFRAGGELPDPACTPGAIDPKVTAARLCDPGYSTRGYRPGAGEWAHAKWDIVVPLYGITGRPEIQFDHKINLDLAGSNDLANLWPQVGPTPNAKDSTERRLHNWVCDASGNAAQVRLSEAQAAIAADWRTAERVLNVTHSEN